MKERSITNQKLATQLVRLLRRSGPPAPPRSLRGWRPPCQGWGACPRRDRAKAFPALHAKMELHLLSHAAFTRFCSSGTASSRAKPARLAPLRRRGDTNVVSIASWAPCHKVNPSKAPTSRSRTKASGGHPRPSLAAHLGCPASQKNPASERVGGHIGMCERTRARASGGVCTTGCGKVGPQFWSSCWWASS